MQKYVSFLSQLENRQNQHTSTAFEGSTEHNEISFDQLLQKSEENTSPCIDNVFNQIQINVMEPKSRLKEAKNKQNVRKQCIKQKNEEMVRDREQFNRRLEQKLSKSKQKYKKETINLHVQKEHREQISSLQKENQELKKKVSSLQSQIEQLKIKLQHSNEEANKLLIANKQAKILKAQVERIEKEKENNAAKMKSLNKKLQKCDQTIEELQKKVRVKQKQMKKMEELQEERSNYYQNLFKTKEEQVQKIKAQLSKKSQEIYKLTENCCENQNKSLELMKLVENIMEENKDLQTQIQEKMQLFQRINNFVHQGVCLMEEHLKQPIQKSSNYSSLSGGFSSQTKTFGRKGGDEAYFKHFLNLILQIIERNKAILNRKSTEIKNFQGIYEVQLQDLDKKMSYLIEENKHLKVKNQEIHKNYTSSIRKQPAYEPFSPSELKRYMSSAKISQPKIREQILSSKTVQVLEQIERARKIYKETSTRIESSEILKQRDRCKSETNLFKRSRRSLSWKKPAQILKQYV